ncbi:hypothetical protein Cgig2_022631 [Carnegiea gigantea]|uniref:Uncharacterized protein n=1 Tax=Carnegiea gigantea TaxID=171969 RepID=A0A9Q1JKP9_9CARY|nr:hypothetical protein Cgig2_022631 [Carnegiea gigantea]
MVTFRIPMLCKNNSHTYSVFNLGYIVEISEILIFSKINSHAYLLLPWDFIGYILVLTLWKQFTYLLFTLRYTILCCGILILRYIIAYSGILLFTKISSHTYLAFTLGYTIASSRILLYRKINSHTYLVFTQGHTASIYGIRLQTQFTYLIVVYPGIYNCNFWGTHALEIIHIPNECLT